MINRNNYLHVQEHLEYLGDVQQLSSVSLSRYKFYLRHLLIWADEKPLAKGHTIKPAFPAYVTTLAGKNGQGNMSFSSQKKIIESSKRFYLWARDTYARAYGAIPLSWIQAFRPSRTARLKGEHVFVTLEDVLELVRLPADETDLATRRDQAAAAMLFLSGMRASAFTTLPIKAVNLDSKTILQWPEYGVRTKNSKRATTFLLPIPELLDVVKDWDEVVRNVMPESAPWYAPIDSQWGEQSLSQNDPGANRHLALNKRLRLLWDKAKLEYRSAHKFRHGHAVYGLQHARTMADYKAVSMNLMHEDIKITDEVYAPILSNEVQERIANLDPNLQETNDDEMAAFVGRLSNTELSKIMIIVAGRLAK